MNATTNATTTVAYRNGRNSRKGDSPAAFITMISESVASLFRVWEIAIISAIGAMISTSAGMTRLVMPRKVRMVWPWLVIRSMPRSACVIQITPVRLTSPSVNDASVVRKIYLSIDPIVAARSPTTDGTGAAANIPDRDSQSVAGHRVSVLSHTTIPLIGQQNGSAKARSSEG